MFNKQLYFSQIIISNTLRHTVHVYFLFCAHDFANFYLFDCFTMHSEYIGWVYIMNFFNKYKDLFGVPEGTPVPRSKLTVNNNLFIDKPFVPTYQQTLSINSKLRDLRKDYSELEQQIQSINVSMRTPRRASSRKGKQILQVKQKDRDTTKSLLGMAEPQKSSPFLKLDRKKDNRMDTNRVLHEMQTGPFQGNFQQKDPFAKKRITWLKDEQVNLVKHSQMNYIFNHKIKEQYPRTKNISEMPMPKAQNFMFGSSMHDNNGNTNVHIAQPTVVKGRNEQNSNTRNESLQAGRRQRVVQNLSSSQNMHTAQLSNKRRQSNKGQLDREGALRRRDEAKRNMKTRRERLGYMYRTSW